MNKNSENSYSVEEAARLKGTTPQGIREQIKNGKIPGCVCTKKGKNFYYNIPKIALDNHLRGSNAVDIENIRNVVREVFLEIIEDMAIKRAKEMM